MDTELKKTPLIQKHIDSKARIVDFGGWAMPLEYQSILKEAKAVRSACGLFDASHMGQIWVRGKEAEPFLQNMVSNDISSLARGRMQYNLLVNPSGGVIDDLMVYSFGKEYLCVVNASNIDKDFNWFKKNNSGETEVTNESSLIALLCLQGPRSLDIMRIIFGSDFKLDYMCSAEITLKNKEIFLSRSGYTGEDGFEIYCSSADAEFLWDLIVAKGKEFGLALCGLGCRDILRIEAGYPLYGHELAENINPLEAGLGWAVKLNKNFIGKDKIIEMKNNGLGKKRIGFLMKERAIARQGYQVYNNGDIIGEVTSGTYSPNLDKFIGMAYVKSDFSASGQGIDIKIRDKFVPAQAVGFPFVQVKTGGKNA